MHVDIDTTVTPLFGAQEGALPGPNPPYQGRPSYHPILARVAEINGIFGAQLHPGNAAFGERNVPTVVAWITAFGRRWDPTACFACASTGPATARP